MLLGDTKVGKVYKTLIQLDIILLKVLQRRI